MPTVGCHTDDDGVAGMTGSTERSAPRPLLWRLTWSTLVLCASVVLLVGLGFLWFIRQVPADPGPQVVVAAGGDRPPVGVPQQLPAVRGVALLAVL